MTYIEQLNEAVEYIQSKLTQKPEVALILGSGLGVLADNIQGIELPYNEIPHFPVSTVEGHKGQFVIGELEGKQVIAMQGRFHYYEGYDLAAVTFPIRVLKLLGVDTMIVTNAAGGVNKEYQPGDLMLIADHLNLTGQNPLIGHNLNQFGPRFPDMSNAYDKQLREKAKVIAESQGLHVREGVYAGMTGPSYETPAEIRMLRTIGADAIGMSTVHEVIIGVHSGIKVLGISCISNMAAGILPQPLSHQEVIETTERVKNHFIQFVRSFIANM
ncbi:purine-nucleoside phosphorylase [Desulfuribacillus stibiiarsenatis]|uniref:Purine nucleoside phosphorylase n=1 Tax=Desulfuribacillus stibiiarsenatis TaxID=1390249 RepID=A0A1E5L6C7_9FIRM|nr:purine-nucleoside phosphorylase [Desulfuribacillus stibiiarsenatis]OEH85695.1 purine-nucleoside phosphorylase [Desulfuribacillus stibiiarsenatis]